MLRFLKVLDYRLLAVVIAVRFLVVNNAYSQTTGIGTVVDNFTIPIPDPDGICTDGAYFWIPNRSQDYGPRTIYKIDIWTHNIVDSIECPVSAPDGIAWDGSGLWVRGLYPNINTASLVHVSPAGIVLSHIPAANSCYWAGIAWDGKDLYYGANVCFASPKGEKSMIYKVDPKTGVILASFPPPSGNINGLVYNKGHLWYCDDNYKYIFEIDTTGQIVREFRAYGGLLSGVTIAKGYLWAVDMAGINGPRIYEIDIGGAPAIPQELTAYAGKDVPGKIILSWSPSTSSDVRSYRIYREGPLYTLSDSLTAASLIGSVPSNVTAYTDSTIPSGLTFAYWVSAVDSNGVESHVSNAAEIAAWPGVDFVLEQNYPNPFSFTTTIRYEIPYNGDSFTKVRTKVNVTIYDVLGRKVATLVDGEEYPGDKTVIFNAANLPSGVYFCRMRTKRFSKTEKLLLIK